MLIVRELLKFQRFEIFNGKMPRLSKQARHLKKAREIEVRKLEEAKKNDKKQKIDENLNDMDEPKLELLTRLNSTNSEDR